MLKKNRENQNLLFKNILFPCIRCLKLKYSEQILLNSSQYQFVKYSQPGNIVYKTDMLKINTKAFSCVRQHKRTS